MVGSDNDDSVYAFLLDLWKFCTMCIDYIHLPLLPDSLTLPYQPNFVVLFVFKPIKSDFAF